MTNISFINYIKSLKNNYDSKLIQKKDTDDKYPLSFFFCDNHSLNLHSFSNNILDFKYYPLPIPSQLINLKLNYEKKVNQIFDCIKVEYYNKIYPNYWVQNFSDDVFILFIVIDESKCYIEYKNDKKLYKKEISNLEYIIKRKKTNQTYTHRVSVEGDVYVMYMYNSNSILKKQNNFNYYKLDYNDKIHLSKRLEYCTQIKEYFKIMKYFDTKEKNFSNILSKLKNHKIQLDSNVGNGTWGEVYKIKIDSYYTIALKISKIDKEDISFIQTNKINKNNIKWHEQYLFKNIIGKNPHPNIPLYVESFGVSDYSFDVLKQKDKCPALITMMELCDCDLNSYLLSLSPNQKLPNKTFLSIFFQICSAIHHMQMLSQHLNRDIKPSNILCIRCKPGGVWQYNIKNQTYYVPNTGIICLFMDFGVSRTYSPVLQLGDKSDYIVTGMRYAIHDTKNSTMLPFRSKNKKDNILKWDDSTTSMKIVPKIYKQSNKYKNFKKYDIIMSDTQQNILNHHDIDFIKNDSHIANKPWIIPPLNFLYDIQDICKMFCNYKLERCENRNNTRLVCNNDICDDCHCVDANKKRECVNKCKKCSYICKKCILSKRYFQNSFHTTYKCFDHVYIRQFLNKMILDEINITVYPTHSRFYLMAKTIEYLFSSTYSQKNDSVIETYNM